MALGCFASISVMNVAFIIALIVLVIRVERNAWKLQNLPGIDLPVMLYAAAFVISASMGVDSRSSFEYITELKRPMIAYVIASSITTRRDAWLVTFAALLGGVVSSGIAFHQWSHGGTYKLHNVVRTYAPYELMQPMGLSATHNDLATLLAMALGLSLVPVVFYFSKLPWARRFSAALISLLFIAAILRTLSRSSSLAVVGGFIGVGLTLRPRRLLAIMLAFALAYPFLPASLKQRHDKSFFDLKSNYSNWFRYRMMEISAQIAKDHMPWGIGRRNFPKVHEKLKAPDEELSPHAHNNYLQILCEMGIPGIIAFVWIQVAVVMYLARRAASVRYELPERMLLGGILMGFLTFVANGFFHYDWGDALPCCYMWILVGMGCAIGERLPASPAPEPACGEPGSAASKALA